MRPFAYARADDAAAAVRAGGAFLGGGTTLLDLMKLDVLRPERLTDIGHLSEPRLTRIERTGEGLRLGALARMADVADNREVARDWPVVAQSLWLAASAQLRNMARLGGNVLQKTRCHYYRSRDFACNRRDPGSGCAALDGFNRAHAILGTSAKCIATYPGDFGAALIALDATVDLLGPSGPRSIRFADLHRLPGDTPQIEYNLQPGELITGFLIPGKPWRRSLYRKIRDRESYEFALASAAVALDMDGNRVRDVRIGLGGVATVPWRAKEAEAMLRGNRLTEDGARAAAEAAFAGAGPLAHNRFKVPLGQATLTRALLEAQALEV